MCSVNEVEQAYDCVKGGKLASKFSVKGECMKCSQKAVVLVRNNDPFCKECFLNYVVHKFRATIGKARVIRQGEKVLVAVSGGSSSSAMLDLVIKGLSKDAVKKHRFHAGVLHIDDEGLCGQSDEERTVIRQHVEALANSAGFPYHDASLSDLFMQQTEDSISSVVNNLAVSDDDNKRKSKLKSLFMEVSSVTAKEDLLMHLYRNLFQKLGKDYGYDHIMVGNCGTNLAVRILADVAQGRGSQLPFNIGFRDGRGEVSVVRPLREFSEKEIQFYNHLNNLTSFTIPTFSTKSSSHSCINRLTEELVFRLQASFPSTINTVLKTGNKISSDIDAGHWNRCTLCLSPIERSCAIVDSESDTSFMSGCESGECVSNCRKNASDRPHNAAGIASFALGFDVGSYQGNFASGAIITVDGFDDDGDGAINDTVGEEHARSPHSSIDCCHDGYLTMLCYGCRLIYHDFKDEQLLLPKFMADNVTSQSHRMAVKSEMKDFVLHD